MPVPVDAVDAGDAALVLEALQLIDEAKIRTAYTAMFYPPLQLAVPNWPPYDGNWPLPASTVPEPAAPR